MAQRVQKKLVGFLHPLHPITHERRKRLQSCNKIVEAALHRTHDLLILNIFGYTCLAIMAFVVLWIARDMIDFAKWKIEMQANRPVWK